MDTRSNQLDEAGFANLVARHKRELHVHCYRMTGVFDDADDLVQETLIRAWNARESLAQVDNSRAWLYRAATNACIDHIRRKKRTVRTSVSDTTWLQPYPQVLLDELPSVESPDARLQARAALYLAYLTVIQRLPARQRAILLLRDVEGLAASEVADALNLSLPAVNSALQRARRTLALQRGAAPASAPNLPEQQELLRRYIAAHEQADVSAMLALLRDDIRVSMPPSPREYVGAEVRDLTERNFAATDIEWQLLVGAANHQPAAICYRRKGGSGAFVLYKIDVLAVADGRIAEIVTFGAPVSEILRSSPFDGDTDMSDRRKVVSLAEARQVRQSKPASLDEFSPQARMGRLDRYVASLAAQAPKRAVSDELDRRTKPRLPDEPLK